VGGSILGGIYIVGRLAERHLVKTREEETRKLMERTRKSSHFSATESTYRNTFLTMFATLRTEIQTQLDTEAITSLLREKPGTSEKLELWQKLKVLSISRCIALSVCGVHLAILLRCQLSMLAGTLYRKEIKVLLSSDDHERDAERLSIFARMSPLLQEKFLAASHRFVTEGVKKMCSSISALVTVHTSELSLQQKLYLSDLQTLFREVFLSYTRDLDGVFHKPETFLLHRDQESLDCSPEEQDRLNLMFADCVSILSSEDTKLLAEQVCGQGMDHLLDRVSEHYTHQGSSGWMETKESNSESDSDSGFVSPVSISLPVAKLIPILSAQVRLSQGENDEWLNHLQDNPSLRSLGANVYEAFTSSPQESSDSNDGWWPTSLYRSVSSCTGELSSTVYYSIVLYSTV